MTHDAVAIDVLHFALSEPLRPYFTALYLFTITCPPGELIEDTLHPEWATMRLTVRGPPPIACVGAGALEPKWPFVVSGPTSKAIRFGLQQSQIWGLGLQPAGLARYVPIRASDIADTTIEGSTHPAFASLAPLLAIAGEQGVGPEQMAERIERYLLAHKPVRVRQEGAILAVQTALGDQEVASVDELCARAGVGRRSLERLCCRYFGFPPKLLLRRQRFLRSLAQFTLHGRENWSRSLDEQYHDHAHFVHEFREFMGMAPTEYAAMPHPILDRIIVQRLVEHGALSQTNLPTLLRYGNIA